MSVTYTQIALAKRAVAMARTRDEARVALRRLDRALVAVTFKLA